MLLSTDLGHGDKGVGAEDRLAGSAQELDGLGGRHPREGVMVGGEEHAMSRHHPLPLLFFVVCACRFGGGYTTLSSHTSTLAGLAAGTYWSPPPSTPMVPYQIFQIIHFPTFLRTAEAAQYIFCAEGR